MSRHGQSQTSFYDIWDRMIQRCTNSNDIGYKNYGGRGITICKEWFKFENFYNWALNNGYRENLQIDRKDNDKGYYPDNCRWITRTQNQYNRGPNKQGTSKYKGVSWAKKDKRWRATIKKNGKQIFLGNFKLEIDAAIIYNQKAKELFGEYAYLNKIEE